MKGTREFRGRLAKFKQGANRSKETREFQNKEQTARKRREIDTKEQTARKTLENVARDSRINFETD